jgi:protease-4
MNGEPESPAAPQEPASPQKRPRRWQFLFLAGLYALSVAAAVVLLLRAPAKDSTKSDEEKPSLLAVAGRKTDCVGMISVSGPIYEASGQSMFDRGTRQWARRLERLAARPEVKALVISINSPGGSVGAVQEMHGAIQRVRREVKKPVVAHLIDVAASGGYYLAAPCDKIVANPGALIGSIGVIFYNSNIESLFQKIGIKTSVIKSGKMKDIGSMTRPMTEEERQLLQALIDNAYGQFFRAVSEGRRLSAERLKAVADGRIFTGEQGLAAGLVDQLGDSTEAVLLAARLGGISDAKPKVVRDTDSFMSVLELIDSRLPDWVSPSAALLRNVERIAPRGLEYRWR